MRCLIILLCVKGDPGGTRDSTARHGFRRARRFACIARWHASRRDRAVAPGVRDRRNLRRRRRVNRRKSALLRSAAATIAR